MKWTFAFIPLYARCLAAMALVAGLQSAAATPLVQVNLVSDIAGLARFTDPNLRNPWGIAESPSSPFWISDNHTGLATLYNTLGQPLSLVVTIPPAAGAPAGTLGSPTGVIFNPNAGKGVFGGAPFVFATEDGVVAAWTGGTTAIREVDESASHDVFKGLATANDMLYATDFFNNAVDVFDAGFKPVTVSGGFTDPNLPAGYAPFGIRNIDGLLFVTYAILDPATGDDVPGLGHGLVDVFDPDGVLQQRLITGDALDSPWGLALAPAAFPEFPGALLVGNFGNGLINAYDPATGAHLGVLTDNAGKPIANDGLWALQFGNGGRGGKPDVLYITAGLNDESDGLFAAIAAPEPTTLLLMGVGVAAVAFIVWRRSR